MEDLEETRIMDDMENQGFKLVQATIQIRCSSQQKLYLMTSVKHTIWNTSRSVQ